MNLSFPEGRSSVLNAEQRKTYQHFSQLALPRHTSYPVVPTWSTQFGEQEHLRVLEDVANQSRDLSIYVHVPFCEKLCYYCACTKIILPKSNSSSAEYSSRLMRSFQTEISRKAELTGRQRVRQLHFGGGTPTYLHPEDLEKLFIWLREAFDFDEQVECAVEVDPRVTSLDHLNVLYDLGVRRLSLGVQDFDPHVQRLVNRIQPYELVRGFVDDCRAIGYESINFDLIYGLPSQTLTTMQRTLEQTESLSPDRIAFYRLAVIPEIFKWQRLFARSDMPNWEQTLDLNLLAIQFFQQAGYEFIGLDHFAKPDEALSQAARNKSMVRSFQGMSTGAGLDLLAFGPSGISQVGQAFVQSQKDFIKWSKQLEMGTLATEKGYILSEDDLIRQHVLQQIYGYRSVDCEEVGSRFGLNFKKYFESELKRLAPLKERGLVTISEQSIDLAAPLGFLLSRVVAAVFDAHLPKDAYLTGLASHQASRVG